MTQSPSPYQKIELKFNIDFQREEDEQVFQKLLLDLNWKTSLIVFSVLFLSVFAYPQIEVYSSIESFLPPAWSLVIYDPLIFLLSAKAAQWFS